MVVYISEQYLKDRTNISNNVDTALLKHNIIKAQDMYISDFIGDTIDAQLKDKLEANPDGSTLTDLEKELLQLIKKALVEFAAYMSYIDVLFRIQNKAGLIANSDNANSMSSEDLKYIRDIAKENGNFYLNKIKKFFYDNSADFSSFKCDDKNSFTFGVYYPDDEKTNLF